MRETDAREKKSGVVPVLPLRCPLREAKQPKDAERRQTQGRSAVPLARQLIQRDAHACRRSTTVLAKGTFVAVWLSVRPGFLERG
jgi:hypothetical protein